MDAFNNHAFEYKEIIPDISQIDLFVRSMFKCATPGSYVSLRAFVDDGSNRSFRISPVQLTDREDSLKFLVDRAYDDAYRAANDPKKIVFCPPVATFDNKDHAREIDIAEGLVLSVECDQHPQESRQRLEELLEPATLVVESGGQWVDPETGEIEPKLHLYWRLAGPAKGEDLKLLKEARKLAAAIVGGDPSNVPVSHPIRWPGSFHRKGNPVLCLIQTVWQDNEVELTQALAILKRAAPRDEAKSSEHQNDAPKGFKETFFTRVNTVALRNLSVWVPVVFPSAEFQQGTGAYRVRAQDLGRDCQEDLSIHPDGVKDWGVWDDKRDIRKGKRTPVDILIQAGHCNRPHEAALWLCEKIGVDPQTLGWEDHRASASSATTWNEPDLSFLDDQRGELPDFPVDAFSSKALADWVTRAARGAGTNVDQVIVPLLGIASSLVGTSRRVRASSSWSQPLTLWTCVVGYSGDGKTPGQDVTKRIINKIHAERKPEIDALKREHETRVAVAKEVKSKWEDDVKEAVDAGKSPPVMPAGAEAPPAFIVPRMFTSNVTIERLAVLLQARPAGTMVLLDELAGLFSNMSRYSNGNDRAFWLEAWNGGSYSVERMSRPPVDLDALLIGVIGGIQPDKIAEAFGEDNDGMMQRFLYGWPVTPEHQKLSDAVTEMEPAALAALTKIAKIGNVQAVDTKFLPLLNDARRAFEDLRAKVHGDKANLDGREREYQSKIPAHVLRLAGTMAILDWGFSGGREPDAISADIMQGAVRLMAEYFWPHARASMRMVGETNSKSDIRRVLRWIKATGATDVTREQLRCEALSKRLNADETQDLIDRLVRAGWLKKAETRTGDKGRPSIRYNVNPALLDE